MPLTARHLSRPARAACVLSIAGSDSSAGAGIQADLKTFAAFGVHGLTAFTAITAQNTRTINSVHVLPPALVLDQLDTLRVDFRIAAVKIGMLGNSANIRAVAQWLQSNRLSNIVIDPVLISSSGQPLLNADALSVLRKQLLPLADVLTPNLPEAEALLARRVGSQYPMRHAARDLLNLGARAVLLKGGHKAGARRVRDYFIEASTETRFEHTRLPFSARGTGCTLAAAIAAGLALEMSQLQSVRSAERYVQRCFRHAYRVGKGEVRFLAHIRPPTAD